MIGWSVHSAATLPLYLLFGFSPLLVAGIGAVCILIAGFSLSQPRAVREIKPAQAIPMWTLVAAALVAVSGGNRPAEVFGGAVWLADATSDHAKIAMIDTMAHLGLPPVNPVFGEAAALGGLAYYYLAFQRRRDSAHHVDQRLGSRSRSDVVHSIRIAQLDDGSRRLAKRTRRRGAFRGGARRSLFAVGDAPLDFQAKTLRRCWRRRSEWAADSSRPHGFRDI